MNASTAPSPSPSDSTDFQTCATGSRTSLDGPRSARFQFAGISAARLVLFVLAIASLCWAMWVTKELRRPPADNLVSVSISKLVGDFVTAQARSNVPEDVAAIQTALYMKSLDNVLKARSAGGTTILVSEAVIASSARDITAEIRTETATKMAALSAPAALRPAPSSASAPAQEITP
jgi:Type-F conjugative transfer system protein (TrbI_Ftype)